jgi:autotransporter-associated beta strand protein
LENRLVPSSTYLWTGAGATLNWDDGGNWSPAAGATGSYPGSGGSTSDIAQFVDTVAGGIVVPTGVVDAAFTLAEIDFGTSLPITLNGDGSAGHTLTVTSKIAASDTISPNSNLDQIAAPLLPGSDLQVTNTASSAGSLIALNGAMNLSAGNLSLSGSITVGGVISGPGGVAVQSGTATLSGANTYTGPSLIAAGATVYTQSATALGVGDVTVLGTLNVSGNTFGTGLPVTWYAWGGTSPRSGAGGNPPASAPSSVLAYAAGQGVINDGIPYETSATPNPANLGGTIFEYGGNKSGLINGFPVAVQNNNGNGSSTMGIWQGLFLAQTAGSYDFATGSDDGSLIYVDGNLAVDNNDDQGYTVRDSNNPFDGGATTAPSLTAGVHTILIEYYNGGGGYQFDAFLNGNPLPNSLLGVPNVNLSLGSLTGSGTVNLAANGITVGGDNNSTTFTGTLSGTPTATGIPNLTKAGTGTLAIPSLAHLQITGNLAIASGTLQLGNGTAVMSPLTASSILDNGTLILDGPSGGSLTYNGNISGTGGLTQLGAWTLTLGGNNSYTGPTVSMPARRSTPIAARPWATAT